MRGITMIVGGLAMAVCVGTATGQSYCPGEGLPIYASDGQAGDIFGWAVEIDGDAAIVSAKYEDTRGSNAGAVYFFERIDGTWVQVARRVASDGQAGDEFGSSVAISGDLAVVGAWADDDLGANSGAAYIYERVGGVWTQVAKIMPLDGAAGDVFGARNISISEGRILVPAKGKDEGSTDAGAAYIFEKISGEWTQTAKLVAPDGQAWDLFGEGLFLSGSTAIVGSVNDDDRGSNAGAAYIFQRVNGSWIFVDKIHAPDGQAEDWFGAAVAIDGDIAIVGAPGDDDLGPDSGTAYVFERIGNEWRFSARLNASDERAGDFFGGAQLGVRGNMIVVGARYHDDLGTDSGAAYIFEKMDGAWTQTRELLASDGAPGDFLGRAVSVSDDTVIVGAYGNDDRGGDSGSIYFFHADNNPCCADLDRDGFLDAGDFFAFLDYFTAGDARADFTGDGVIDAGDFFIYLDEFAAGCP